MATRFTSALASAANVVGLLLACGGTTTHRLFCANTCSVVGSIRPSVLACAIVAWSAEASTSTGAPRAICCSKVPEAAKFRSTFVPGLAFSYALDISRKLSVRLEAAETVRSAAPAGSVAASNNNAHSLFMHASSVGRHSLASSVAAISARRSGCSRMISRCFTAMTSSSLKRRSTRLAVSGAMRR